MKKCFSPKGGKKPRSFCCVYLEKVRVMCRKVHKDIKNVTFSSQQVCVMGFRGFLSGALGGEKPLRGRFVWGKEFLWDSVPLITQPAMPIRPNCLVVLQPAKSMSYWRFSPFLGETFHPNGARMFLP